MCLRSVDFDVGWTVISVSAIAIAFPKFFYFFYTKRPFILFYEKYFIKKIFLKSFLFCFKNIFNKIFLYVFFKFFHSLSAQQYPTNYIKIFYVPTKNNSNLEHNNEHRSK